MYVKMSFFVGIFVVAPYILYQVWAFISPGLYSHEKAYAVPFIVAGSLFFVLGGAFGHFFLLPPPFQLPLEFPRPHTHAAAPGRRLLLLLPVVPARPGSRVPDPGRDLRAGAHRAGDRGLPAEAAQIRR